MKSYNGLFDRMTDRREAVAAIEEAARYKTKRKAVQDILARRGQYVEQDGRVPPR